MMPGGGGGGLRYASLFCLCKVEIFFIPPRGYIFFPQNERILSETGSGFEDLGGSPTPKFPSSAPPPPPPRDA